MSSVMAVIEALKERLPELDYQLNEVRLKKSELPKGLFKCVQFLDFVPARECIDEVRFGLNDLKILLQSATEADSPLGSYLAKKIALKMQVLLQICHARKKNQVLHTNVEMKQLVTRDQWLKTLHDDRERLLKQRGALQKTLQQQSEDVDVAAALKKALTDVEERLSDLDRLLVTLTGARD